MRKENQKMTIQEITTAYAKISDVIQEKKVFAGEVNLAIAKNVLTLENELKNYEKSRKNFAEKFASKDEQGNPQTKKNEYIFETVEDKDAYIMSVQELMKTEVEVEINRVRYELLEDEKHDTPSAANLVALDFMLDY